MIAVTGVKSSRSGRVGYVAVGGCMVYLLAAGVGQSSVAAATDSTMAAQVGSRLAAIGYRCGLI